MLNLCINNFAVWKAKCYKRKSRKAKPHDILHMHCSDVCLSHQVSLSTRLNLPCLLTVVPAARAAWAPQSLQLLSSCGRSGAESQRQCSPRP